MGKKKGGKKSKIEGAQRSRSASKCEDSTNKPIVIENQENLPSEGNSSKGLLTGRVQLDLLKPNHFQIRCSSSSVLPT